MQGLSLSPVDGLLWLAGGQGVAGGSMGQRGSREGILLFEGSLSAFGKVDGVQRRGAL